jgi:hypothetical protein
MRVNPQFKWTRLRKAQLIEMWSRPDQFPCSKIAEFFGITYSAVSSKAFALGLPLRGHDRQTDLNSVEIFLLESGMLLGITRSKMAEYFGVNLDTIHYWATKFNKRRRTAGSELVP